MQEWLPVTAVVVNYNSGNWLARCLTALRKSLIPQIIVVDNGSSDDSLYCLRAENNATVEFLENPGNPGYAVACNQGLERAEGEFVLFLNPDCELLDKALESLVLALLEVPGAVLAGPWVINARGEVQRATLRRLPTFTSSAWEFLRPGDRRGVDQSKQVKPTGIQFAEAISGACMLARAEQLRRLNGFDPQYRLHCEDLDLMKRAQQAGYRILLVPDALVIHQQGISSQTRPVWVEWQKHRGMWRYYRKFEGSTDPLWRQLLVAISILGHFVVRAPWLLYRYWFRRSAADV